MAKRKPGKSGATAIPPNPAHHDLGKSRRGKITGKPGEPAKLESGKPAVPDFDPAEVAELLDMWWMDGDGDKFLVKNGKGGWTKWPKTMVNKKMREIPGRFISLRPRDGESNSEADRVLLHTMENRCLDRCLDEMAGYSAGVFEMKSKRVMIKHSPRRIAPVEGDWTYTRNFIEERLGPDQSRFFHSWLKASYRSLTECIPGEFAPGQALILSGAANSAKSRLQHQIITPLLGWRSADPGAFMFGKTDFNDEMIEAEHLLMEDPINTTLTKDRVYFGEMVKAVVVNDDNRLHPKGKGAITGTPYWRLSISVNDDPDKMRVLPLITPDIEDKLMIFRVQSIPITFPDTHLNGAEIADDILERRKAFREKIYSELPAYAWWLINEWAIPAEIRSERFGVKHYHDETLVSDLFEDTPGADLLNLIDASEFTAEDGEFTKRKLWELPKGDLNHHDPAKTAGLWHGKLITLEALLTGEMEGVRSSVMAKAKQFFRHNNGGKTMARLLHDSPSRIDKGNTSSWKGWRISRPIIAD